MFKLAIDSINHYITSIYIEKYINEFEVMCIYKEARSYNFDTFCVTSRIKITKYIIFLGKSVSTIRRIAKEGQTNKGVFSTPGKHRAGRPKKELDDFDLCAIRQKVQFCYTVKKIVSRIFNY